MNEIFIGFKRGIGFILALLLVISIIIIFTALIYIIKPIEKNGCTYRNFGITEYKCGIECKQRILGICTNYSN